MHKLENYLLCPARSNISKRHILHSCIIWTEWLPMASFESLSDIGDKERERLAAGPTTDAFFFSVNHVKAIALSCKMYTRWIV